MPVNIPEQCKIAEFSQTFHHSNRSIGRILSDIYGKISDDSSSEGDKSESDPVYVLGSSEEQECFVKLRKWRGKGKFNNELSLNSNENPSADERDHC